jgi:hypothetical protein
MLQQHCHHAPPDACGVRLVILDSQKIDTLLVIPL